LGVLDKTVRVSFLLGYLGSRGRQVPPKVSYFGWFCHNDLSAEDVGEHMRATAGREVAGARRSGARCMSATVTDPGIGSRVCPYRGARAGDTSVRPSAQAVEEAWVGGRAATWQQARSAVASGGTRSKRRHAQSRRGGCLRECVCVAARALPLRA
jgi:hypothetical protein